MLLQQLVLLPVRYIDLKVAYVMVHKLKVTRTLSPKLAFKWLLNLTITHNFTSVIITKYVNWINNIYL